MHWLCLGAALLSLLKAWWMRGCWWQCGKTMSFNPFQNQTLSNKNYLTQKVRRIKKVDMFSDIGTEEECAQICLDQPLCKQYTYFGDQHPFRWCCAANHQNVSLWCSNSSPFECVFMKYEQMENNEEELPKHHSNLQSAGISASSSLSANSSPPTVLTATPG